MEGEIFDDGAQGFQVKDKNTFEDIMLTQIRETSKALSKDLTVSITKDATGKTTQEDRRKIAINHVTTLRYLIAPFIKNKIEEKLKELDKALATYQKEWGNKKIKIQGRGEFLCKDIVHDSNSLIFQKMIEFKISIYKDIFGLLLKAYKGNKDEIASMTEE